MIGKPTRSRGAVSVQMRDVVKNERMIAVWLFYKRLEDDGDPVHS